MKQRNNTKVQTFFQLARDILWKLEQPNKGKLSLFRNDHMPIFMHAAETWTKNKADKSTASSGTW